MRSRTKKRAGRQRQPVQVEERNKSPFPGLVHPGRDPGVVLAYKYTN